LKCVKKQLVYIVVLRFTRRNYGSSSAKKVYLNSDLGVAGFGCGGHEDFDRLLGSTTTGTEGSTAKLKH
jgi:hypothetical protein